MNILHYVLYGILGAVLYFSGIDVTERPGWFLLIMLVVFGIDYSSYMQRDE
jgi:surface polysaccharide O-acyltransferase-like enzyme